MEPLSVAIHSVSNLGGFRSNQSIAVFGAGPVGLLCMAVAKALGASRIIAIDIVPERLEFAKSYAATDTYLPPKPQEGERRIDFSKRVVELMYKELGIEERGEKGIDLVLDASGAEACIQMAIYLVKIGGTFIQVRTAVLFGGRLAFTHFTFSGWHGRARDNCSHHSIHYERAQGTRILPIRSRGLSVGHLSCFFWET